MANTVADLDTQNSLEYKSLTAELARYKERVKQFEERQNVILSQREKLIDSQIDDMIRDRNAKFASFQTEIDALKQDLSKQVKEKESLSTKLTVLKTEFKERESLSYQNPFYLKKARRIRPTLYDGNNISKQHVVVPVIDDEETLILEEESRSKMFEKLKDPVAIKQNVVKVRTTPDAITKGSWGFKHTKFVFINEVIPFLKSLKDIFNAFDTNLINEITEVQTVFNQMEAVVEQCSVDKKLFDIQLKESLLTHNRLLDQIMSQDIVNIVTSCVVNESVNMSNCVNVKCSKCLELKTELIKKSNMIERDVFDKLSEPQSEAKDTVINKLKDKIKSLSGKDYVENVKKDIDEIETINIELEHSVAKLLFENENFKKEREHLKSIYKDQFDSIKKTRVQSKEHSDSLIAQINAKSVKNSDLNAQLQEKFFAITALKNELRKLKAKNVVDTVVSKPIATTLAPGVFKIYLEPIPPKLLKDREAHKDYLKYTQEQAAFLREIVEQGRSLKRVLLDRSAFDYGSM
ncbi:hypothetical protein Tco_0528548 [Tanacetum coccineum]